MSEFKILNVEPDRYSDKARAVLAECATMSEREMSRDELIANLGAYDVLITRLAHQIDREILLSAPRLRAVASATTGLDHIDTACAQERGIAVLSLKGETAFLDSVTATAEHTWGLLLSVLRSIPAAHGDVMAGHWDRDSFRGRELSDKTIGIVGYGRLGRQVAQFANAFRMSVIAFDPYVSEGPDYVQFVDRLDTLLQRADVVSLHVPLNDETEKMIDAQALSHMADDALLINTSRGALVDEEALLDALKNNRIGGVGTDVLNQEATFPSQTAQKFLDFAKSHKNVVITPHVAGATSDSMAKTEIFIAEKINRFLNNLDQSAG